MGTNPFDIIRTAFKGAVSATQAAGSQADTAAAVAHEGLSAGRVATELTPAITPERANMHAQLAARKQVHLVRNTLLQRAEELRRLGGNIEIVARNEGAAAIAPHQGRYDRKLQEVADLLIKHDTLLTESGQPLDGSIKEAVDLVIQQRDAAKVVKLTLPTGETALEARINQLLGDKPPIRRPIIDASGPGGPSLADRMPTVESPQQTVDRYTTLMQGGSGARTSSVPSAGQATGHNRTLPDATTGAGHNRTLPAVEGARKIGLPTVERPAASQGQGAPSRVRENKALNFLDRRLDDELTAGEEVSDEAMKARLKELRDNPDAAPGFQGVGFEIGSDNSGVVKIRI